VAVPRKEFEQFERLVGCSIPLWETTVNTNIKLQHLFAKLWKQLPASIPISDMKMKRSRNRPLAGFRGITTPPTPHHVYK
jgi:hypothetical protein